MLQTDLTVCSCVVLQQNGKRILCKTNHSLKIPPLTHRLNCFRKIPMFMLLLELRMETWEQKKDNPDIISLSVTKMISLLTGAVSFVSHITQLSKLFIPKVKKSLISLFCTIRAKIPFCISDTVSEKRTQIKVTC